MVRVDGSHYCFNSLWRFNSMQPLNMTYQYWTSIKVCSHKAAPDTIAPWRVNFKEYAPGAAHHTSRSDNFSTPPIAWERTLQMTCSNNHWIHTSDAWCCVDWCFDVCSTEAQLKLMWEWLVNRAAKRGRKMHFDTGFWCAFHVLRWGSKAICKISKFSKHRFYAFFEHIRVLNMFFS